MATPDCQQLGDDRDRNLGRRGRADVEAGRAVYPSESLFGDTGGHELRSPTRVRLAAAENADIKRWTGKSGNQRGNDELVVVDQDDDGCLFIGVERVQRPIGPVG